MGIDFNPAIAQQVNQNQRVQFGQLTAGGRSGGGAVGGAQQRSEEMAEIRSFGELKGINSKDTYGLDGAPTPPEGLGQKCWTYA